jgi:S-DNA-T family DNA segregation ATPase FtsK/SpoIIIE
MKRGSTLNWFTKALQRMFSADTDKHVDIEFDNDERSTYIERKTPFRFPLISDKEKDQMLGFEPPSIKEREKEDDLTKPLYMHNKWQEDRSKTVVHQSKTEPYVNEKTQKVMVQTKTFKPTQVPSPVHGFGQQTTKPIEELLAKKQSDINEIKEVIAVEKEPVLTPIIQKEIPSYVVQQTLSEKPIDRNEADTNSMVSAGLATSVDKFPLPKQKSTTLPFNVMMLKSDKERLDKNIDASFSQKNEMDVSEVLKEEKKILSGQALTINQRPESTLSKDESGYQFPSGKFLVPPEQKTQDMEWMQHQADRLIESLSYFQVKGEILQMVQGPAVTQFEMRVGQGTKVSKIRNLADDLKLALAAKDIRIQAPIPGKSSIGIEIPNRVSRPVRISEVVGSDTFISSESPLEAALGLDLTGKPVTIDLRKMPHGLIAGATGSGKSVCINSILISLLYKASPSELKMLLIDPKMVELAPFNHIPHLVSPVITDVKAATAALRWAVEEMERRYQLFAHVGVRDITRYNTIATEKRQFAQKMPYLLIVIDELADLMMMAPTEVEEAICRIAQKARACGIHLVVATQRPSVDVITGLIKANIPTRIAFSVSSQVDSRTILDGQGAERLLGRGDMLYLGNGMSAPIRLQGTYVTDDEMEAVIEHARSQGEPSYLFEQEELVRRLEVSDDQDELFEEACRFILEQGSASTSLLQRKYHIGYNRAARLVDLMEQHGYVSEQKGSKAREVFITKSDIDVLFG